MHEKYAVHADIGDGRGVVRVTKPMPRALAERNKQQGVESGRYRVALVAPVKGN